MTISDWILKGTCYWLSRIEFQKVPVTDYLILNVNGDFQKKGFQIHSQKVPARYLPGILPDFMPGI